MMGTTRTQANVAGLVLLLSALVCCSAETSWENALACALAPANGNRGDMTSSLELGLSAMVMVESNALDQAPFKGKRVFFSLVCVR